MKLYIIFFFSLLFHGENIATFTITKDDNHLNVKANLSVKDVKKALEITDVNAINTNDLTTYFDHNLIIIINDQVAHYKIDDFELVHNHLIVDLSIEEGFETITSLRMKNTLLFEVNSKQSNILEIRFNNQSRDFLIHKDQPALTINL